MRVLHDHRNLNEHASSEVDPVGVSLQQTSDYLAQGLLSFDGEQARHPLLSLYHVYYMDDLLHFLELLHGLDPVVENLHIGHVPVLLDCLELVLPACVVVPDQ